MLIIVVQTHKHGKRHRAPLKNDVASFTSSLSASRHKPLIATLAFKSSEISSVGVHIIKTDTLSFLYLSF